MEHFLPLSFKVLKVVINLLQTQTAAYVISFRMGTGNTVPK